MNSRAILCIDLQNQVNAHANALHKLLAEYFTQFVGQPILTAQYDLRKKIRDGMPKYVTDDAGFSWYLKCGRYSVTVELRTSGVLDGVAEYRHQTVYLLDITDNVLKKVYGAPEFRVDLAPKEIEDVRSKIAEYERLISQLKNSIRPF